MATRGDLKARILDDLERGGAAWETRVENEINSAIDYYQKKRFWFSETRAVTITTAEGVDTYAPDNEFYKIDEATVVIGGVTSTLRREDYQQIEISAANFQGKGQPWSYAYLNGSLRLYPNPNGPYTIRLLGHFKVTAPADDAEANNPWMNEAFELIRCRAKLSLAIHVIEDDNLAARMAQAEPVALSALNSATFDKIGEGRLVPTQF